MLVGNFLTAFAGLGSQSRRRRSPKTTRAGPWPGFRASAVLSLGLGIGATTANLGYSGVISYQNYRDLRQQRAQVADLAAFQRLRLNWVHGDRPSLIVISQTPRAHQIACPGSPAAAAPPISTHRRAQASPDRASPREKPACGVKSGGLGERKCVSVSSVERRRLIASPAGRESVFHLESGEGEVGEDYLP